jgi:MSHA biogenesis protein MshQ
MSVYNILLGAIIIEPGSQNFTTVGTTSFSVPNYNTLTIELWGGGASGGGGFNFPDGQPGGSSSISQISLTAGGGGAGRSRNNGAAGGAGGVASGGNDTNWNGEAGNRAKPNIWTGGRDGRRLNLGLEPNYTGDPFGTVDGGGGRGGYGNGEGGGGGGGAYVKSVYTAGAVAPGTSLTVVVGGGGIGRFDSASGEGGAGARGRVLISWT